MIRRLSSSLSLETAGQLIGLRSIVGAGVLLVVCAFALACSSGNPGLGAYPKAVSAVDETAAIQTLRTIATAEAQMRATRGVYGGFDALVAAGFLDQRFSGDTPNLRGYRFALKATESDFAVNADPNTTDSQPTTGGRHFYLDSSDNVVHVNAGQQAAKNDPSL
jgi:hypothetical protein